MTPVGGLLPPATSIDPTSFTQFPPLPSKTTLTPSQNYTHKNPENLIPKNKYADIMKPNAIIPLNWKSNIEPIPLKTTAIVDGIHTVSKGLLFEDQGHEHITGYIDADWVASPFDRRSTSGYCVLVGGNLVSGISVSVVSQFMTSSCDSHWDAVVRILRYINLALVKKLLFEDQSHEHITGYTDVDLAGSPK
ncbi:hypothetical protein MTR67_038828 [Solanum verrucosum]|uniref:Uncharacterized protein n=1 Tax=Solanum verrucosum TaxID=315347 RepID=A0AAF0UFV3_SOLVR|nr:hypothetical protein MTR67_038828 [Solanum verrucosum]